MNGKGDKSRVTDRQAYRDNYSGIDWGHAKLADWDRERMERCGCERCQAWLAGRDPDKQTK